MKIWTYWEGPKPQFIDLCLRSMQQAFRDEDFHIVTPETLHDYISPDAIHHNYHNLLDAIGKANEHMLSGIRTDCIRAALLAAHGGWWLDADTIGMRSPQYVVDAHGAPGAIYTIWEDAERPPRVLNGYVYMDPYLASEWLQRINRQLEHEFGSIEWCSLGEGILTPLLMEHPLASTMPRHLVLPIDVDSNVEAFFRPGNPDDYTSSATVCFGLNCSYMLYHHRRSMEPPWGRDMLIHRLLRQTEENTG